MENPQYLALLGKFGPAVKHILDCPESNFPALSRSRATNFTENIKQVCPLLFPILYGDAESLEAKIQLQEKNANQEFLKIKNSCGNMNLHQSANEMEWGLFPK